MSDDEEDVTTTKRKRLTKKGHATLDDDSSSEDDDLFGSDNDEEEEKVTAAEEVVDATFSKENLESAMNDAKPFVSPNIEFSKFLESWDDVDKFVSAKEFCLSDPAGLVKFVSNVDEPISLELKCLIIAIARQTCIVAKRKDDSGMAQSLFKSKIKTDKSMHIGNYVSNTWLTQSVEQLKKTETIEDQKNNMHLNILTSGFRFMQHCYVIDNTKKLSVLKEKQNIDWKGTTERVLEIASSKSLTSLEILAKTLTTYLSDFKAISNLAASATGAIKLSRTSSVDSQALQDATKKKREERMRKLRQKAHGAMSLASTPAVTSNPSMPSAVAPPPAPPSSYSSNANASNNRFSNSSGYEPSAPSAQQTSQDTPGWISSAPAPPPATSQDTPGWISSAPAPPPATSQDTPGWISSAPAPSPSTSQDTPGWISSAPAPPPAPAPATSTAPPTSWDGGSGGQQPEQQQAWQANYVASSEQDPRSQQQPSDSTYNDQKSWNEQNRKSWNEENQKRWNSNNYSGGQSSYSGQYDDSYRDQTSSYQQPQESRNNYPVGSGPFDAPGANPQYNDSGFQRPNHSDNGDSYYPGASAGNDNQSGGGGGYRGGAGYDARGSQQLPQQDLYNNNAGRQQYDRYEENNQYRGGGGGGRGGGYNNKRSRQDAFADDGPSAPAGGGGGGRGRGRTLPAWMTNDNVGGGAPPPPKRHEGPSYGGNGGMPPRDMPPGDSGAYGDSGPGREDRTRPSWMANESGPLDLPPPAENLPPPSLSRGPPRGPPPPSFEEPPSYGGGGGRGRGRTLPAWMTQRNEGPGGGS